MSNSIARLLPAFIKCVAIAALAILPMMTFGHAQTTVGTCAPSAVRYKISNNSGPLTTSTSYVTIDAATLLFTQGGTRPSCVIVLFSGEAASDPATFMFLRATIDGQTIALPEEVRFFHNSTTNTLFFETRAANFTFPSVTPGSHRLRLQFKSGDGGFVQLNNTNLTVHYTQ